jgi:DNA gyrase subunit A
MIAIQSSERNGKMVAAVLVEESDEIMLITNSGVLVRTRVSEIRQMGRATQGVTLIDVEDGDTLAGVQRIVETEAADAIVASAVAEQEESERSGAALDAGQDPAEDDDQDPSADPDAPSQE